MYDKDKAWEIIQALIQYSGTVQQQNLVESVVPQFQTHGILDFADSLKRNMLGESHKKLGIEETSIVDRIRFIEALKALKDDLFDNLIFDLEAILHGELERYQFRIYTHK